MHRDHVSGKFLRTLSVFTLLTGACIAPAQAGFEWTPPKEDMSKSLAKAKPQPKPVASRITPAPLPPLHINQGGNTKQSYYSASKPSMQQPVRAPSPAPSYTQPIRQTPQNLLRSRKIVTPTAEPGYQPSQPASSSYAQRRQQPQTQHLKMSDTLEVPQDFTRTKPQKLKIPPSHLMDAPVQQQAGAPIQTSRISINPAPMADNSTWGNRRPVDTGHNNKAVYKTPPSAASPSPLVAKPQTTLGLQGEDVAIASELDAGHLVGFGNDLPLAMALQQVVPANYSYAFGTTVNPGIPVSWTGGKPWFDVLNDMLSARHLRAVIKGKTVHVQNAIPGRQSSAAAVNLSTYEPAAGTPGPSVDTAMEHPEPLKEDDKISVLEDQPVVEPSDSVETLEITREISEDLTIEEVQTTTQVQGSPEEKMESRQSIIQRALMKGAPEAPVTDPSVKITSFAVTTKKQRPAVPMLKRTNIADPGEHGQEQPSIDQLAEPAIEPSSGTEQKSIPTQDNTRSMSLEDMAKMQGVDLNAAVLNQNRL